MFFFIALFLPLVAFAHDTPLDVAIIGGGQAGMSAAAALQQQGITNVEIFEYAPDGLEGPWCTTARMPMLRSPKETLVGPSLGKEDLAFKTWYENYYGNWDQLDKVSTCIWVNYLKWYKKTLHPTINHGWQLLHIIPTTDYLTLQFNEGREVTARKVVLATGRSGCGGLEIPHFVRSILKSLYYHTAEPMSEELFCNKRICVVGAGASAFDVAATALEQGAARVDMLMRKATLPTMSWLGSFSDWEGYFYMSDAERTNLFCHAIENGTPPTAESLVRVEQHPNFYLHANTTIQELVEEEEHVVVKTNQGSLDADVIVLGTGFAVDVAEVAELTPMQDKILLWRDKMPQVSKKLGLFPYLGESFEFLEKEEGSAPYLKNIHCFNYGAFLSHGCIAGDICEIGIGAERLAKGIKQSLAPPP